MSDSSSIRKVYDNVPAWLQNLMVSIEGWRLNHWRFAGRRARQWWRFYDDVLGWTQRQHEDYQRAELCRVVRYAYEHVPFYRQRFDDIGLSPGDFHGPEDLPEIPLLEKDDIRAAGESMISDEYRVKDLRVNLTSGSSGLPLKIYESREAARRNFILRWTRCRPGVHRKSRR